MTRTTRFTQFIAACVLTAGAQAQVQAPPPGEHVLVILSNLKTAVGRLASIDGQNTVTLLDRAGATSRLDASSVLAVVACDPAAEHELGVGAYAPIAARRTADASILNRALLARQAGVLVTVTGERYLGDLASPTPQSGGDQDRVLWNTPDLGTLSTTLDHVSWVRFPLVSPAGPGAGPAPGAPAPRLPPPGADDAVVLENADVYKGLVTALGETILLEPETGGEPRRFERGRVAGVVLSNPSRPLTGPVLYLADGSVLGLARTATERGPRTARAMLRVETNSGGAGSVPLNELRAWTPASERLVALSACRLDAVRPLPGRVFAPPPAPIAHPDDLSTPGVHALGAQDMVFHSAVEAVFELPRGATHLLATAAIEEESLEWGDCEAVITSGQGVEPLRVRLSADVPAAPVAVRLTGPTLTVRIEPGRYGTAKDRLRLMRPLVVVTPAK